MSLISTKSLEYLGELYLSFVPFKRKSFEQFMKMLDESSLLSKIPFLDPSNMGFSSSSSSFYFFLFLIMSGFSWSLSSMVLSLIKEGDLYSKLAVNA